MVEPPWGYVVVRFPASWVGRLVPPELDGTWFEVPDPRLGGSWVGPGNWELDGPRVGGRAVARPTGRFEVRADGAVAEVWAVAEDGVYKSGGGW